MLTERQIRRGVHRSVAARETVINAFLDQHNTSPKVFKWIKAADDILAASNGYARTRLRPLHNSMNFWFRTLAGGQLVYTMFRKCCDKFSAGEKGPQSRRPGSHTAI